MTIIGSDGQDSVAEERPVRRVKGRKLVLLGQASVGKTSLVQRFVSNRFCDSIEATVGAAFSTQTVEVRGIDGPRQVKFEIWDTAGQERFRSLAPMYYRNAACAVVVYDMTKVETFERAKEWVRELQASASAGIVIGIAANKADSDEASSSSMARQFCEQEGIIFLETSAKSGLNVQRLFEEIARKLPEKEPEKETKPALSLKTAADAGSEKSNSCCVVM